MQLYQFFFKSKLNLYYYLNFFVILIMCLNISFQCYATDDSIWREDFSTENLYNFPWKTDGDKKWFVENLTATTPPLEDNESSYISISISTEEGNISFGWEADTEANFDKFYFWIDGQRKLTIHGYKKYGYDTFHVTKGKHLFKWEYRKDSSNSKGSDSCKIFNIQFPPLFDKYRTLYGVITDTENNSPVVNTLITINDNKVLTDSDGFYSLPFSPGVYDISVKTDFGYRIYSNIEISLDKSTELNINFSDDLIKFEDQIDILNNTIDSMQAIIEAKDISINNLFFELTVANSKTIEMNEIIQNKNQTILDLQVDIEKKINQVNVMEQTLFAQQKTISEIQEANEAKDISINKLYSDLIIKESTILSQIEEISSIEFSNEAKNISIANLYAILDRNNVSLQNKIKKNIELQEENDKKQVNIDELNDLIEIKNNTIASQNQTISDIQISNEKKGITIVGLLNELEMNGQILNDLKSLVEAQDISINYLHSELYEKSNIVIIYSQTISDQKLSIEALTITINSITSELEKKENVIFLQNENIENLQTENNKKDRLINDLQYNLQQTDQEIFKLNSLLLGFKSYTIQLSKGWHLISALNEIVTPKTIPENAIEAIYQYSDGGYQTAKELKPTYGYWVNVKTPCIFILEVE